MNKLKENIETIPCDPSQGFHEKRIQLRPPVELTYRTDVLFQAYETSQLVNVQAFLIKQSNWNPHNRVIKNQFIQRVIQKADIRIFENIKIRQSWKRPKRKLAWCQNIFQKLHLNRKLKYGFNVLRDGFIQISHPLPVFDNPYGYCLLYTSPSPRDRG